MVRSFHHRDFPASLVASAKRGRTVSVCIPARDEQDTVGATVLAIRRELMERVAVVDELIVMDDGSGDGTAAAARDAGATVVAAAGVLPEHAGGPGKGEAMWRALHVSSGEVIVFVDADVRGFDPAFVLGLAGPLLTRDDVDFVKGFYERPLDGRPGEGGRVTELMARPLISVFFPHLSPLHQPLAGECAGRREVLESVPFVGGYGVDLGLVIDVAGRLGTAGMVQCDLGTRVHRNRPLSDLRPQALAVLQVGLRRAGLAGGQWPAALRLPGAEPLPVPFVELPPMGEVAAHRKSA